MHKKSSSLYRYSRYLKLIFLLWDIFLLNFSFVISYLIRFGNFDRLIKEDSQIIFLFSNIIWILLSNNLGAYKFVRVEHFEKIISRTLKLILFHVVILFAIILLLNFDDISRSRMLIFYGILMISIFSFRILFINLLKKLRKSGYNFRTIVIIGFNKTGLEIHKILSKDLSYGYKILGFFDEINQNIKTPKDLKILGKFKDLENFSKTNKVHEIYFASNDYETEKVKELINFCENNLIRLKIVPHFKQYTDTRRVHIDFYENIPILSLRMEPLEIPLNRLLKKSFDLFISLFILFFVGSWLFPIIILLIKISSEGPIIFKQKRTGLGNKTFWCYKFRTMKVNNLSNKLQATNNDPRITKIGRFLRKSNLDELPQLFNVIKGEMSIVGPRPHMLFHTDEYSTKIDNYLARHFTKPGITGWAQVNGFRGETKELSQMESRIEYDIWYIENWSILLDLKIILKTVFNMIKGDKNAF
jgi:undecaprenyl-phosphate galactose phosphotransferase/putative colanic acid biosynthesis UDP-glucose lipid carrier transferase